MSAFVKVGLIGLGTVGSGTFNVLRRNKAEIERRAGFAIEVIHVGARRNIAGCDLTDVKLSSDIFAVVEDPDIQIIVELIGGTTIAKELVLKAIENGKHVVTANKALIAEFGNVIFQKAKERGVHVAFEASVAGGIPILKTIREGLVANHITSLAGIINGTTNYILTQMQNHQKDFQAVLCEAQKLGYAEADPTFDIEGIDAAHKLTILASLAFGVPLQFSKVYTEGLASVTLDDISYAKALGYTIKFLGIAKKTPEGLQLRVHPTLVPSEHLIAKVDGVLNALLIEGDAVGSTLYSGRGAGAEPTASAVVADIVEVARLVFSQSKSCVPPLGFIGQVDEPILSIDLINTAFYLRIEVEEKTGVLANISRILSEHSISIKAILQKPIHQQTGSVAIIIVTQSVLEKTLNEALGKIRKLPEVRADVAKIRIEEF